MSVDHAAAFKVFVHEAKALLRARRGNFNVDVARYASFVREATVLLEGDARSYLAWLAKAVAPLEPALDTVDVLHVAGIDHDEDRYTELLAWLLDPDHVGNEAAGAGQRALVGHVGGVAPAEAVRPLTQIWTDDGVPDLVLPHRARPLVVEAKTRTAEHSTPTTGMAQTLAYPPAVRRFLGLAPDTPCDVIFLTLDRSAAASPTARSVSYLEIVWVLSTVVEPVLAAGPVRDAWRSIVGHLARRAVPGGFDLPAIVELVRAHRVDPNTSIVPHVAQLARCEDLLPRSRS